MRLEEDRDMEQHWQILASGNVIVSNTPEDLFRNACKYFKWVDDHPIKTKVMVKVGKEAGKVMIDEHTRPYNIKALCLHCGIDEEYLKDVRKTKAKYSEYYDVVNRILYIIYVQNYELAMVGVFNPIFTARTLGMDTEENIPRGITVTIVGDTPALSSSEEEILEKLELEEAELRKSNL